MTVQVARIPPENIRAAIPALAALRINVFRAYPYLYDGDPEYEAGYLAAYQNSSNAIVVGAWDGETLVGAATGTPLEDHAEEFGAPFVERGYGLDEIFYCGESVLLPQYRGQGIGHRFFDAREDHARALGRTHITFCSVLRDADHPRRPADYRPLDGFWTKRGYAPLSGVVAEFSWKDLDSLAETQKPLQFWMRQL